MAEAADESAALREMQPCAEPAPRLQGPVIPVAWS